MLDNIADKYNNSNTVHRSIKMKPIDVTPDFCPEYNEDSNEKDPKFKVSDGVRISKYRIIFAKGYTQNWSEEVFVISKIKKTGPWTYVISDLNGELSTGSFYEKELQKTSKYSYFYELGASSPHKDDPTLKNSLLGAVTLNKNANIDKYQ